MDAIIGILNLVAIAIIHRIDVQEVANNPTIKDALDYFMIIVLVSTWIRFFLYFLVVRSISKLLLTLVEMIGDTLSFMIIVCCFIIIMASIFTTLFQDTDPRYASLSLSVRMLFDAALAVYIYSDTEK